jgi:hypothetical protein
MGPYAYIGDDDFTVIWQVAASLLIQLEQLPPVGGSVSATRWTTVTEKLPIKNGEQDDEWNLNFSRQGKLR